MSKKIGGDPPDQHLLGLPGVDRIVPKGREKRSSPVPASQFGARQALQDTAVTGKSETDRFLDEMQRKDAENREDASREPPLPTANAAADAAPTAGAAERPQGAPRQPDFPLHLPSALTFFGGGVGIASLVSIKVLEAATSAARFLLSDPHYLYAAIGAGLVGLAIIPTWSALSLSLTSLGYVAPRKEPRHFRSQRLAYGLQILIIGGMLAGSAYLSAVAYRLAWDDWRVVSNQTYDWLDYQKGAQEWRRGTKTNPDR